MFGQLERKRDALLAVLVSATLALAPAAAIEAPPEQVTVAELSPGADKAIGRGLAYLKNSQHEDGSWGGHYLVAHTALAMMAFMVQGHVPDEGMYGQNMDKAITFLIVRSKKHDGYFADDTSQVLYQHGYATLALAEAWGQSKRPEIGPVLRRAVDITLRAQGTAGGWGYSPHPGGHDISCTGTAIQGLASAKEAGILVPEQALNRARRCTRLYQNERTGFFGYGHGGGGGTLFRSGIGPLSLFLLGDRTSLMLKRGMTILLRYPESTFERAGQYHLAHYYAIQASYQAGDVSFNYWYPRISKVLLRQQKPDGSWTGTQSAEFSTALSVLILGVPYRYLPIYQR
ncbi:MAG: prenyltransferase/squalene oxidase repeat-containing protein [Dehalococcoidia bacterium]